MAMEHSQRVVHVCACTTCQQHPHSSAAQEHRRINRLVATADESTRRLLVGFLAHQHGRGGIALLSRITGLDPDTIARGQRELQRIPPKPAHGIRRSGAGRPRAENKSPRVLKILEELLQDATAGDPMSGLKWTHRSLRKIQRALRQRGIRLTPPTIA